MDPEMNPDITEDKKNKTSKGKSEVYAFISFTSH